MRNKIKEIMNKEEGFTLVELLAVIVILGIIVAIAIPAVGSVMDRAQGDADDAEIALVEDATRLYVTTEREEIEEEWVSTTDGEVTTNTLDVDVKEDLYDKGFLEERSGESPLTGTVIVTRTPLNDDEGFTYEYDASSVSTTNQQ